MWQHYKTPPKPNIEALERLEKENDSEYSDKMETLFKRIF